VKNYELIEHTADIGIRVKGGDLKGLFRNAALAMFEILAKQIKPAQKNSEKINLKQKADNPEELFINWLNELLSLSDAKGLIFYDFQIKKIGKFSLEATLLGSNIENYKINTEIKAATYHELKLKEDKSGWEAEVILDV
jgi:SHS2 domain-containing protein